MQLMIDTADETPESLYRISTFLRSFSDMPAAANPEAGTTINGPAAPVVLKPDAPMIAPPPLTPPPIIAVPVAAATAIQAATAPVLFTDTIVPMIPPPPGPASDPLFDTAGVQWSAALHTSTKTKTIDGQWKPRTKRGATVPADTTAGKTSIQGVLVPPPLVPAAIAEYAGPQTPMIPPPPMRPPVSANEDDADIEDDSPVAVDFPTFISNITSGMNAGTVTQKQIDEIQTAHGLQNLFSLSSATPEVLAQVSAAFGFAS